MEDPPPAWWTKAPWWADLYCFRRLVGVSKSMGIAPLPSCTSRWNSCSLAWTSLKLPLCWSVCVHVSACECMCGENISHTIMHLRWESYYSAASISQLHSDSTTTCLDPLTKRMVTVKFSVQCQPYQFEHAVTQAQNACKPTIKFTWYKQDSEGESQIQILCQRVESGHETIWNFKWKNIRPPKYQYRYVLQNLLRVSLLRRK